MIFLGNRNRQCPDAINVWSNTDQHEGKNRQNSMFRKIEKSLGLRLRWRGAVHSSRWQPLQLERKNEDKQNPEPPSRNRGADRREIGRGTINATTDLCR